MAIKVILLLTHPHLGPDTQKQTFYWNKYLTRVYIIGFDNSCWNKL